MRGITRKNKDHAGGLLITGSPTVFANDHPVVRLLDRVAPHGKRRHRSAYIITTSPDVYVNNIKTCRQGDLANCGHIATGSSNVFVN